MLQNLNLTLHEIQERLPSVLVGHVVTPSTASRDRQASTHIFEAMGLSLRPVEVEEDYDLPVEEGNKSKWTFRWNWIPVEGNDRVLERTEWGPVLQFVRGLGLDAHDVSEGQHWAVLRNFCTILKSTAPGRRTHYTSGDNGYFFAIA